jgi:hypothetical protein
MDYKKRVSNAINKFAKRELKTKAPRKKNANLEGPVVLEIKNDLTKLGFNLNVVEAKAVWNTGAGAYMSGQVSPGFPDLCGNGPDGESVWIEVKAKGKRYTISPAQFHFLLAKIKQNCFAVCSDSSEYVIRVFNEWKTMDKVDRQNFLILELPKNLKFLDAANGSGDLF